MNNRDNKPELNQQTRLKKREALAFARALQAALRDEAEAMLEGSNRAADSLADVTPEPCVCGQDAEPHATFDGEKITSIEWICPRCWLERERSNFQGSY